MKPLSPKSLEKKYAELGLSKAKTDLLHNYFLCFANLYGILEVREAWDIFKYYEGNKIRKKDFITFSGIVQREPDLPYTILELNEVYTGEPAGMSDMRLIVNNDLIGLGYGKFARIYHLVDLAADKPLWEPDSKEEFLAFTTDQFYLSPEGTKMTEFLSKLKTNGVFKNHDGKPMGDILDIDGNPVIGKYLSDFVFYTRDEQFDIDYYKSESKKETLRQLYKETALKKIKEYIRIKIQLGNHFHTGLGDELHYTLRYLDNELGVTLTETQLEQFVELYTDLNNHSHLWQNCGWKPDDLFRATNSGIPKSISIGSNLQKLFDSGEMGREEFEEGLRQMGIKLIQ